MAVLQVENIYKRFGKTEVLKGIDLSLEKGEVLVIIGASGSGKTTLMRCLNFLEMPDRGRILVNEKVLLDTKDPETLKESEIREKLSPRIKARPSALNSLLITAKRFKSEA